MEHYSNLISAARAAMPKCLAFRLIGAEERNYTIRDVLSFAMTEGGENERLEEGRFYVVSSEGAIGLANRYEYKTNWMFIPLEGEELENEIRKMEEEIRQDKLRNSAAQGQPMMQPQGQPMMQPQGQPMMQPQGQPMMQPQGQPMMQPQGQPMIQPQGQPMIQPQSSMPPYNAPQQGGKKKFCMQCGYQLSANSKFCPSCGKQTL